MYTGSKGMTLVELVIVGGILSVLILAVATTVESTQKSGNRIEALQELITLRQTLTTTLSSRSICTAAIPSGQTFHPTTAARAGEAGQDFRISLPGGVILAGNQSVTNHGLMTMSLKLTNAQNAGLDADGHKVYRVDLWGRFRAQKESLGGQDFQGRTLASFFMITDAGNNILGCFAGSSMDISSMQSFCSVMNAAWDVATGKCTSSGASMCQYSESSNSQAPPSTPPRNCCAGSLTGSSCLLIERSENSSSSGSGNAMHAHYTANYACWCPESQPQSQSVR